MSAPVSGSRASRRLPIIALVVLAVAAGVAGGRSDIAATRRPVEPVEATRLPATKAVSAAWYCPGLPAAFPTKSQTFTVSNLGASAVRAAVTVHPDDGSEPVSHIVTVPQDSVRTFDRSTLPAGSMVVEPFAPDVVVSTGLESSDGLATVPCATTAGTDWYFAAGTTVRGVSQWLVLEDPFAGDARVDITLRTDSGLQELPSLTGVDVPGRSRIVIPIHDEAVRRERVSVEVHAAVGLVVASQTIRYSSVAGVPGVATSIGAVKPASSWWFADGDTRAGASEVVAIANVGPLDARVNVQAQGGPRTIVHPVQLNVPSGGVSWVPVGGCGGATPVCLDVPDETGYVLLVQSDSDAPIVAQTLTRFDASGGGTAGAVSSVGSSAPAPKWVIARIRALTQPSTTIALADPGLKAARVAVAIVHGGRVDRPASLQRLTVPPGARFVLRIPRALRRADAAVVITSDVPIFAEATIYTADDATRAPGIPAR
ncbi:MAG TPA: DUF5719 family protein [Acidimicrobiia bacterium]|nr:DUF5719 family protein [Acidimicrobiia bacterium]